MYDSLTLFRLVVILSLLYASACTPQIASEQPSADQKAVAGEKIERAADDDKRPAALPEGTLDESLWSDGWISLFDGKTLFGWQPASEADWRVEDGAIVVSSGEKGLLATTSHFEHYELHVEFQADPQTNSGIFLRTPAVPTDPQNDCYELNIAPADNPFPTGSLVGRQKADPLLEGENWRAFDVKVDGDQVVVQLDGQQVLHYTDPRPLGAGQIGLQLNSGRVAFRNIRLRPLRTQPMFNGKDLTQWREYPDMPSKFTVTEEGYLHVRDGRGQLETTEQYGNFIMQLECMTHAANLNSGVFFRCIPGEQMNGYEVQIHNGFQDGDRHQPIDFGTGAIFRRQKARVVAANDQQWFGLTIVADGPHVATWVNGLQIADWTDTRDAHPNPREGLRLEPGTIMLQGHDPTTDISFRKLGIVAIP